MQTIAAADYRDIVQVEEPRVAPDGDRVAFVRKEPDDDDAYAATIHVVPTGGAEPRRFTLDEGVDSQPRWSPSGDRLAFVSTRGADDDTPQLWVLPTDGGEARQVTDVVGGVGAIAWSPDGTRIAFTQRVTAEDREEERDLAAPEEYDPETPDPRVIDRTVYRSMQRYFDGRRSHVYLAHLGDDDVERVTDGDYDFVGPEWGDAETLYYASEQTGDPDDNYEYDILAYDTDAEDEEQLHRTTGWSVGLSATADGRIAHVHVPPDQASLRQTELHVYDRADGSVTDATAGLDRSLGYDATPQWGPDGDELYFATADEGSVVLWRTAAEGEADHERVVGEDAHVAGAHVGDDVVAYVQSEWDHPGDVFLATRAGADETRLTSVNGEYLANRAVCQPEELRVEHDGVEVQGWVLTPPDFDERESYPLAVEIHGGPHAGWSTSGTMWHEFQTLAAEGYVVFWCNPRGSTGYGEEFAAAIERDWGAVTLDDVMAGVREVADREYVDADDAFVTGGSFGGYMAAWAVGHTDFFDAAVSQRGVYDLTGFYGSTDKAFKLVEGDYDTTPWAEPEFLWEQSPVAHCDDVDTPTLVVHSDDDYRTPANTAELFYRGLKKHGVDTRMVRYPDEGHELSRSGGPAHVVDRIERIVRWFDGYSDHDDAERAVDRPEDDGLSAGESEE